MKRIAHFLFLTLILNSACQQEPVGTEFINRPNILFILADDQRADALGAAENAHIQTPNIDSLAISGTRFTNMYCMGGHHGAICAPSRAMIMSGRSLYNVYDKIADVPTMPQQFRKAGYVTFGTGKWHNEQVAFSKSFDYGKNIFFGGMSDHFLVPVRDLKIDSTFTEVTYKPFSTDLFADATLEFLTQYAGSGETKPFFSYMAFTAPHDPRSPHPDYIGQYQDNNIPVPLNYRPMPAIDYGVLKIRDENLGAYPRTPQQIQKQLADYYALISHIDDRVGDVIRKLKALNLYENTIIVYTADHGLAVGSHGLLGKQNLYEHSMKSPMIIAGPGIPENQKRDALVYLYDLFPTLANYASVPLPDDIEGQSLVSVINSDTATVRDYLMTTYAHFQRAIRNDRWKLIRYPDLDYTELFDLENDPNELTNLAASDQYESIKDSMLLTLAQHQKMYNDTLPLTAEKIRPLAVDLSDYYIYPDPHQPIYTLDRYFTEARKHPLSDVHYQITRSGWYRNNKIEGFVRNYNQVMHQLIASDSARIQYFGMMQQAQEQGILKEIPENQEAFNAWFK